MKPWLELLKLRITVASTVTTFVGYVMARGQVDMPLVPVLAGIMLQACGAAALNQVQDAAVDARMPRTAGRPIPSGRVNRTAAFFYSLFLLAAGSALLWTVSGTAALLGLAAGVVYNGVYTPLKRVTPFAALPGSFIGALPPVVGWVAAGGYLSDPTMHLVAFFFFLWQIPHFWLLLLFYEKDYADGGMPSMFDRFDRKQIVRLTFLWIAAVCVAALMIPMAAMFDHKPAAWVIAAAGLLVVARAASLLRVDAGNLARFVRSCRIRFMEINTFALLVSTVLVVDSLV
ncbi:MAG: protoheme IX farnesyltransferase, partial [Candidatus Krumholzibacteriota bacterium]